MCTHDLTSRGEKSDGNVKVSELRPIQRTGLEYAVKNTMMTYSGRMQS